MEKYLILIICILAFYFGSLIGITVAAAQFAAPGKIVQKLCDVSRTTGGISEETCAEVQDYYNFEYLCREANSDPNNRCWVEANYGSLSY